MAQDINRLRAQYGIAPLALNPYLIAAAQAHTIDIATNANYSHYGIDGSSVYTRVARVGYGSNEVSENWVSVHSPGEAIGWWMNSYVHRTNLLNGKWTQMGVGAQVDPRNGMIIFVAVFGRNGNSEGQVLAAQAAPANVAPIEAAAAVGVPLGGMDYTIASGDTLMGIAMRYGVPWERIASINGLGEQSVLQIGRQIRVPNVNDPLPGVGGAVSAAQLPSSYIEYVVQPGDTLSTIAVRYRLTWQEIASLNGLGEFSVLELGRVVRIPSPAAKVMQEFETAEASVEERVEESAQVAVSDAPEVNAPEAIATENAAAESAAQSVALSTTEPAIEAAGADRSHIVQPGETVISIAAQHGLGWGELLEFNGLTEDSLIQIGQELRLP